MTYTVPLKQCFGFVLHGEKAMRTKGLKSESVGLLTHILVQFMRCSRDKKRQSYRGGLHEFVLAAEPVLGDGVLLPLLLVLVVESPEVVRLLVRVQPAKPNPPECMFQTKPAIDEVCF
jgi:hypothetical protein